MSLLSFLRTTPKIQKLLELGGIKTPKDFFLYFPRTYEDREQIKPLRLLVCDKKTTETTKGIIVSKTVFEGGRKKRIQFVFHDIEGRTGYITFFNSPYQAMQVETGITYIIIGKPKREFGKVEFINPTMKKSQDQDETTNEEDVVDAQAYQDEHVPLYGRIYPIYPELLGIKSNWFAQKMRSVLDKIPEYIHEYLPKEFLDAFELLDAPTAVRQIHFPDSHEMRIKAHQRVFFDRLLRIQLYSQLMKKKYIEEAKRNGGQGKEDIDRELVKQFVSTLPFPLTNAQKKVIKECLEDIEFSTQPMMRLLQGDVGSGKTIVACALSWYIVKKKKGQIAILAPLAVLAQQHFTTFVKFLFSLGIRIELLIGSTTPKQKEKIKQKLATGQVDIVIGTHALLQEDISFANLQLVVIDEQHKFGVKQRSFLKKHGNPHILQMSATPIPRSLALAFYGEFTVSILDELPAGRKQIHTKVIGQKERSKIKPRLLQKVQAGQKVFVVTPLISESDSEKMQEVADAITSFEDIKRIFPELQGKIGLLHGKMSTKEKNEVMKLFKEGTFVILVATTVIEVGVDIPEATIIIIRSAERFGLSQLHQLRGRIGRNNLQSYCFLETATKTGEAYKRLKVMEQVHDGFKLAELDLEYRGPGEILGTKQSGETDIPLEILRNIHFIQKVQEGARWLLERYPDLVGLPALKKYIEEKIEEIGL